MSDSIRHRIVSAIAARLEDVTTAKGFATEAGRLVLVGEAEFDRNSGPALVLWPGVEENQRKFAKDSCAMPIEVEGFSPVTTDDSAWELAEKLLADIREAMTGNEILLSFEDGTSEIQVGHTVTGAVSAATGYVAAVSVTSGTWTGGNAAGTLRMRSVTGNFTGTENLKVSGSVKAKAAGAYTLDEAEDLASDSLANDIEYVKGGTIQYPEAGEISVGVSAAFTVHYHTLAGNPYAQ